MLNEEAKGPFQASGKASKALQYFSSGSKRLSKGQIPLVPVYQTRPIPLIIVIKSISILSTSVKYLKINMSFILTTRSGKYFTVGQIW